GVRAVLRLLRLRRHAVAVPEPLSGSERLFGSRDRAAARGPAGDAHRRPAAVGPACRPQWARRPAARAGRLAHHPVRRPAAMGGRAGTGDDLRAARRALPRERRHHSHRGIHGARAGGRGCGTLRSHAAVGIGRLRDRRGRGGAGPRPRRRAGIALVPGGHRGRDHRGRRSPRRAALAGPPRIATGVSRRSRLRERAVAAFFIANFLMLFAHAALYVLFSLYLQRHGYSNAAIGFFWAISVFAEIALFRWQSVLFRRFTAAGLFAFSIGVAALRFGLVGASAGGLLLVLVSQLLHAVTFGLHHSASMALLHGWFGPAQQGRAQALYVTVGYGCGGTLGG